MERTTCNLNHYFIVGQQKYRLFLILSLRGKRTVACQVGNVGKLRQILFTLTVLLPALVESIRKEAGLWVLSAAREQRMDEHWLFAIFVASKSELSLQVKSESIEFSLRVLDDGMVGSAVNGHHLHILKGVNGRWLRDVLTLLSELAVAVSSVPVTLVLIYIVYDLLLRMRACSSPILTAIIPWPTFTQPLSSRFSSPRPHLVR